jgi:16S rRNA (guanine966-N2)-methyltransferase
VTRTAGRLRIIAGRWGGRRIRVPAGVRVRPTSERVREAWMSILGSELADARVLDLYAGSGALGLEALSRGAAHVTFVESDPRVLDVLRVNLRELDAAAAAEIVRADGVRFLHDLEPAAYDLILADPPYGRRLAAETVRVFRRRRPARWLALEHHRDEDVESPPGSIRREYGETVLLFVPADEAQESG